MKMNNSVLKYVAGGLLLAATITTLRAADVSGTWTWSAPGRNGNPDRVTTLTVKSDGTALTGTVSTTGKQGKVIETPIAGGKVEGDVISFIVVHENKGKSATNSFTGTIKADQITGKISFVHDGAPETRDWEAKRASENK